VEYLGAMAVVAGVVAVLIGTGTLSKVLPSQANKAFCTIGLGNCASGQTSPDRRDAERDARNDRRNRGRGDVDQQNSDVPGVPVSKNPLGAPVAGVSAQEPEPPAWSPPDKGAGVHGSDSAGVGDHVTKFAAEAAANAVAHSWPNASRNLLHFLGNSGEPITQDVNVVLKDVPEFQAQVDSDRGDLGTTAVQRAKQLGVTGPTTFPVDTPWAGYGYDENGATVYKNQDWFYAMGGWSYNETGQVTVYPPDKPGGSWRYEVATRVNLRDRYNWDGGKSTQIGPFNVTDKRLAELHRSGLAQEYTIAGRSDTARREGTVP
jgi:hypothetical protein